MSKNTKLIIIISLTAVVLIGGAVFGAVKFKNSAERNSSQANAFDDILANMAADDALKLDFKVFPKSDFKNYIHAGYGFSFDYPADWSVDIFKDDVGDVAVIQNAETGILIYVYPFDEPGPITKERILRDVPDMTIENGRQIKIGEAGVIDVLIFDSDEREMGPSKEMWFVHGGFLYQISAAEGSGEALNKIIESWKFN
ncbi:hypothetical protein KJ853_02860 [Patescibacteria group bacterium]|nr:hypothetical protein [Patescibacteria group bacterium]